MTIRDEVTETLRLYLDAYRAADANACAACYLPDGAVYSPYAPPALGRAAIKAVHDDWLGDGGSDKTLEIIDFGAAGDLAWCMARFTENAEADEGWSLNVLERQSYGRWLIRTSSLNGAD